MCKGSRPLIEFVAFILSFRVPICASLDISFLIETLIVLCMYIYIHTYRHHVFDSTIPRSTVCYSRSKDFCTAAFSRTGRFVSTR